MPLPMDLEEFDRWISQARHTLRLVSTDIEAGGYDWACFKAQQACELALKALLRSLGREAFGHNVLALYREAVEICGGDEELEECVSYLDKLYIPPRYPDAFPEGFPAERFTEKEALRAEECARRVLEWVEECVERR